MMDLDLILSDFWTSGARRLLQRAAQAAALHQETAIGPVHLLWALLQDEGRAGIWLEVAHVTSEIVRPYHPELAIAELEQIRECQEITNWNEEAWDIVREARLLAHHEETGQEAGTNHLLNAFLNSAGPVAEALRRYCDHAADSRQPPGPPTSTPPEIQEQPSSSLQINLEMRERSSPNLTELYRILDAAANRGREGLRVIEDYARFGGNHRQLSQELKGVRHELADLLNEFPQAGLLASRDSLGDVGTSIETAREYHRTDILDVLTAAFKRVQEALRTLEEYSKIVSADIGRRLERLRYRVYTLEKAHLQTLRSRERLAGQHVYLLLTDAACPGGVPFVLKAALDAGVRLFQVREKSLNDRTLLEHCRRLRRWTGERGALLIINDRPDIAALCEADGVHVGQEELSVAEVRRIVGPDRLVGVSTHSIEQARQAVLDGADYLGVGPTFPSQTKTFEDFPGLKFVKEVAAEIALPWFAIGGITENNLSQVIEAGARRVAVTRAISAQEHPLEAGAAFVHQLQAFAE